MVVEIKPATCKKVVEEGVSDMFFRVAREYDLPSGDMTVAQENEVEDAIGKITKVLEEYVHQNLL